ncbi:transcriptional regulator [Thermoplasmatales archaeon ex4484_30]|nr:MAG: transcriptional regulator [Thermoplasmatales archaeon ex4484_30]
MKKELLTDIRHLLARAGFYLSEVCTLRPSSFDFVARRDNLLLIIKVLSNIDSMNENVANELLFLAKYLDGVPILIGEKTSSSVLEDDVVYYRHGIPIITYKTMENYLHGILPIVCAAPGGFYANFDGEKIRKMREERGISLGHLARIAGVSRRTIRMYESGERASIEVAERIVNFLGEEILKPINFLEIAGERMPDIEKEVNDEILSLLESLGMSIFPTSRCPFNALSELFDELFLVGVREKRIMERARLISNVSKVVEKDSVFFVEKSIRKNIEGIPIIVKEEIKRIKDPFKIVQLIKERE